MSRRLQMLFQFDIIRLILIIFMHGMITLVYFYKYNKIIRKRLCLLCVLLTRRLHFKSLENVKFLLLCLLFRSKPQLKVDMKLCL